MSHKNVIVKIVSKKNSSGNYKRITSLGYYKHIHRHDNRRNISGSANDAVRTM